MRSALRTYRKQPETISANGETSTSVYQGKATDQFGHSYFVSNPEVSADLIQLIRHGRTPGETRRPLIPMGASTWKFP